MNNDYVGYCGSFLISINLIPQIYHIYKIKNVKSISIISYFLNIFSAIFMIAYGVLINKFPIIISNSMILIFSVIMLFLKYLYKEEHENNENIV